MMSNPESEDSSPPSKLNLIFLLLSSEYVVNLAIKELPFWF